MESQGTQKRAFSSRANSPTVADKGLSPSRFSCSRSVSLGFCLIVPGLVRCLSPMRLFLAIYLLRAFLSHSCFDPCPPAALIPRALMALNPSGVYTNSLSTAACFFLLILRLSISLISIWVAQKQQFLSVGIGLCRYVYICIYSCVCTTYVFVCIYMLNI